MKSSKPSHWLFALLGLFIWLIGGLAASPARADDDFLPVEQAFRIQVAPADASGVQVDVTIAPRTHLYKDRLSFTWLPEGAQPGTPVLPEGKRQFDDTFGKEVEVYYDHASLRLPLASIPAGTKALLFKLGYQGCADDGLCYPPQTRHYKLAMGEGAKVAAVEEVAPDAVDGVLAALTQASPSAQTVAPPADPVQPVPAASSKPAASNIETALASGSLLQIVGVFFLAGLLLSFTPCVLPMVPILSSIIVGEGQEVGRLRGFLLALSYSQGMAVVYTALGVVAGLLGEGLSAYLQTPAVLGTFGVLLVLFSLSMFGAFELQMPSFIQGHLSQRSGRMQGGHFVGVFIMGLVSALIVGPCVTGPLAGALVYISHTRDVVLGGAALYALAWGMSMPLLLVGVSAGALLPRTGMWMESVKTLFGMVMLGVAWWLVSPVLPPYALLGLLGVWFALGGAFLGGFDTIGPQASVRHRAAKGLGAVMVMLAVFQLIGAVTGASSPWSPLSEIRSVIGAAQAAPAAVAGTNQPVNQPVNQPALASGAQAPAATPQTAFRKVHAPAELEAALAEARAQGRVAMVDFYADWCVACKEMEHLTFTDPRVRQWMSQATLIQADVTAVNSGTQALLKRFGLFGPPGIVFFDHQGAEMPHARVIGFQKADDFLARLRLVRS